MTISSLRAFGLVFEDLYTPEGLQKLDHLFLETLKSTPLNAKILGFRENSEHAEGDFLTALAPPIEDFIAQLFGVEKELAAIRQNYLDYVTIAKAKRLFVQRVAAKALKPEEVALMAEPDVTPYLGALWTEADFANHVMSRDDPEMALIRYAAWALYHPLGQEKHSAGTLFKKPNRLDFDHLVNTESPHLRERDGFKLTDKGFTRTQAADQLHYCIWCHHQNKDSCSKGLKEKGTDNFQKNPMDAVLSGCPLDQKISEMHEMASLGHIVGALAIITLDNPMVAATGHRICNECMKACIYQKQDPVDIPATETRILRDVLSLPYGVEIYSLLTRWNPLNAKMPYPKPLTGHKTLVVGQGPAGFTLAHYLLNEGVAVTAIDGLKIEPMRSEISGVTAEGKHVPFMPIKDWHALQESLDERIMAGFGGVAEYGITVRWDKNFLMLIRLMLERRTAYQLFGSTRFGSTLTLDQAYDLGFDHIALAMGAGKPRLVEMQNNMAKGVRMASDFLMALQLTGAAKKDSFANLQLRLPALVIGGGLTAIDTATEALAYYPLQVEKFLARYEALQEKPCFTEEEQEIADEFIAHATALRKAKAKGDSVLSLLKSWGGVSLLYRKRLQDAPSYRLNHEEVQKALEEGISIIDETMPLEIVLDRFNHAVQLKALKQGVPLTLEAKSILVAAGTVPNTILAHEEERFKKDGLYFEAQDIKGQKVTAEQNSKTKMVAPFTHTHCDGRTVSFLGDLHPSFAGNVVKAMASAKRSFPLIVEQLRTRQPQGLSVEMLQAKLNAGLRAVVSEVKRLTPTIVEVIVKAPYAAQAFAPGQFYRLQNFEVLQKDNRIMEALALTGAWVDKEQGLLSTIVLEMGGSSDFCAGLKPGEPISLMGPTGMPTEIMAGEKVLLIGGGLGNAVLFSIGQAFKKLGSEVLYVAGYKKAEDIYKVEEIKAAADHVIWCCEETFGTQAFFHGNVIGALRAYHRGELGKQPLKLNDIDRIIAIGSDRMMRAVAEARSGELKDVFNPTHKAIGSINSPMQCMMKEICAQCIQKHIDHRTGAEHFVFSCANQDQSLDEVDFTHLHDRLSQNNVWEKLTKACLLEGKKITNLPSQTHLSHP